MTTYTSASTNWGSLANSTSQTIAQVQVRVQAVFDAFIAVGMIQTADTGQCVIASIASITTPGYFIFRFNDAAQATYPLFIKWYFGRSGTNANNNLSFQIGTGTNGGGTLTGGVSSVHTSGQYGVSNSSDQFFQVYACHTEGFFGLGIGLGNTAFAYPSQMFTVSRTRNSAGNIDGVGYLLWGDSPLNFYKMQFVNTAGSIISSATEHYCLVPGIPTDTALLNGDKQLYPHFYADPDVKQLWSQFTVRAGEFPLSPVAFSATPVAVRGAHTFLFGGSGSAPYGSINSTSYRTAFLWE